MRKIIRVLAVGVVVAAQLSAGTPTVLAQGGKSDEKQDHSNVRNAITKIENAQKDLERVNANLGGRRGKALELLKQAHAELREGLAMVSGREMAEKGGLNINSATIDQIRGLPGLDESDAKKIRENRPYAKKEDLVKKKVIGEGKYDQIKDMITVGKGGQ